MDTETNIKDIILEQKVDTSIKDFSDDYIKKCMKEGKERIKKLKEDNAKIDIIRDKELKEYCKCSLNKIHNKSIKFISEGDIFPLLKDCITDLHKSQKKISMSKISSTSKPKTIKKKYNTKRTKKK